MLQIGTSEYLAGLLHMAAACSEWIGHSWVEALCYDAGGFPGEFAKHYRLRGIDLEIAPSGETPEEALANWLGEGKAVGELAELIRNRMGEDLTVCRAREERRLIDALSWSEGGKSMFYFVEDVLFLREKDSVAVLMMGNNE